VTAPEIRDPHDVHDEAVAGWTQAVAAAVSAANGLQVVEGTWLDNGLPAAIVGTPAELEAAPSVVAEQPNEPPEAPAL
jgi:hypothetical protein